MKTVDRGLLLGIFLIEPRLERGPRRNSGVEGMKGKGMGVCKEEKGFRKAKAVIFDFDGTLAVLNIDFALMRERVLHLVRESGIDEASIQESYLLEIIEEVYQMLQTRNSFEADHFYQRAHEILQKVEVEAAQGGRLIPGTEEALRSLMQKGIKVGIVTRNCEDAVRRVFPNIHEFCDVFVSRNSVKNVKPHPDHLMSAMKALSVSGDEVVMVGDHVLDILAGKRVGMRTVGVLTGRIKREEFEQAEADYILDGACDICKLF
jgi:phosphoglycolate phosphatase